MIDLNEEFLILIFTKERSKVVDLPALIVNIQLTVDSYRNDMESHYDHVMCSILKVFSDSKKEISNDYINLGLKFDVKKLSSKHHISDCTIFNFSLGKNG